MQYADIRLVAVLALCAGLGACASITEPLKALKQAVAGPTVTAAVPAPATAPAPEPAAPPAAEPAKAEVRAAVNPAVQRAFESALAALRAGRIEDAERGFRALVKSNPELGGPHANLGLIYRQMNKLPESAAALEQAVSANPEQAVYANQLGITYRQQGQFGKAREAYEKAIALDAAYATAHLNLAILHDIYLWDSRRALELYDRYLALSPGGDATVSKWVADLKNRKQVSLASRKEKE